ncbi:IS1 family transposase [Oculatella sp. LEGE 06141]|uniref:IS1 family transposase n=1 Tax=Oculatella sp. LEGE 06141 TaxID=1828648 RepID=UPI001882067E|nr:IS1 family transposase [Oculatella sp. LEGE 06141]MBE9177754.1 IS1 family transposase [Oculatella sp. LEGE 06141]
MVDHLEPYRRMARSIRFVPPIWDARRYQHLTEPTPVRSIPWVPIAQENTSQPLADPEPSVDPSAHAEALIRAAVSQPTTLPIIYVLPESIGDRISKLTDQAEQATYPAPQPLVMPPPKIPQPDPNWVVPSVDVLVNDLHEPLEHRSAGDREETGAESENTAPEPELLSPTAIDSADSAATNEPLSDPVAHWFGSVGHYLESVAHTLESGLHGQTEPAAPPPNPAPLETDVCPKCTSAKVRKNGRRSGKPKYRCQSCGHQFAKNEPEPIPVKPAGRRSAKGFGTKR